MELLSKRLKAIRKHFNLNQIEMASKLGITQSYYSALERGSKKVGTNLILALIELFKVSESWLISGKGTMFIEEVQNIPGVTAETTPGGVGQINSVHQSYGQDIRKVQIDKGAAITLLNRRIEEIQFIHDKLIDIYILLEEMLNIPFDYGHVKPVLEIIREEIGRFSSLRYDDIQKMSLQDKQEYLDRLSHVSETSNRTFFDLFSTLFLGILKLKKENKKD